jgi:hypothetical protein
MTPKEDPKTSHHMITIGALPSPLLRMIASRQLTNSTSTETWKLKQQRSEERHLLQSRPTFGSCTTSTKSRPEHRQGQPFHGLQSEKKAKQVGDPKKVTTLDLTLQIRSISQLFGF